MTTLLIVTLAVAIVAAWWGLAEMCAALVEMVGGDE